MTRPVFFLVIAAMVILLIMFADEVVAIVWSAATGFGAWFVELTLGPLTEQG